MRQRNMLGAMIGIAALGVGASAMYSDDFERSLDEPLRKRAPEPREIPYVAPVKNGKRKQRRDRGKRKARP